MSQYVQMYCKPDSGYRIQDNCCGSIMVMLKLNLVKGKTTDYSVDTSNITAPPKDYNHGTMVLK